MSRRGLKMGIIAEDKSDVASVKILIQRMAKGRKIGFLSFVGRGGGKIAKKCHSWACAFKEGGCTILVVIQDSDGNDVSELARKISEALSPCPITKHLVVIPVQELEAWFLSDPAAIKKSMKIKKLPKIKSNVELIDSPKEVLGKVVRRASGNEVIYLNTKHNIKISEKVSIQTVYKKCPSFVPFYDFIVSHTAS